MYFQRDATISVYEKYVLPCLRMYVNKFNLFFKTEWMTRTQFIPSQATLRANTTEAFKTACKFSIDLRSVNRTNARKTDVNLLIFIQERGFNCAREEYYLQQNPFF